MKIAIVILNWNGKKLLEQFLPSVVNFSENDAEIYVADNASTDDSIRFVKENYPDVKIIKNSSNGGYAKGYNDALKHVKADVFCLLNSDIEVTKNWLKPIIEVFKNEENTAIIQPKLLDFKDKSKFEYAGAGGGFIDLLITFPSGKAIAIENKIYAGDQPKQMYRYSLYKGDLCSLYYLNLYGGKPSPDSLYELTEDNYSIITYKHDIITWLNKCLGIVKSGSVVENAIKQYQILIK